MGHYRAFHARSFARWAAKSDAFLPRLSVFVDLNLKTIDCFVRGGRA
jgi:hypothetical protein